MPKADAVAPIERKTPPKQPIPKNGELDIPTKVKKTQSAEMFGELDESEEFLRVCFYGLEGSGKSTNGLTLANSGRMILVNAEGGAKKRALARRGIDTSNIAIWPQNAGDPITKASLDRLYNQIKADLEKDPNKWNGIMFDSSTDITQGLTSQVSDHRIVKAERNGAVIDDVDQFFTDVADYGTMTKMFVDSLRKFRDLPLHVVYTALERRDVDKKTGDVTIGPAVTPGVATSLLGYVDIVIHCTAGDDEYPFRGLTNKGGIRRVKDRFGILPRVMVEPTMERIIEYAEGKYEDEVDPKQALLPVPKPKVSGKKPKPSKDTPVEAVVPVDADA